MIERPILFKGRLVRGILDGIKTQTRRLPKFQPAGGVRESALSPTGLEDGHGRVLRCQYGAPGDRLWVRETFAKCLAVSPVDGQPMPVTNGDRLIEEPTFWVDEKGNKHWHYDGMVICYRATSDVEFVDGDGFHADAGGNKDDMPTWKPSIHMPRWASRIDLEVTEVRVQRLQDITEEDARAEGMAPTFIQEGWACMDYKGRSFDVFVDPDQEMRKNLVAVVHQPQRMLSTAREVFARTWDAINGKRASWDSNPWVWAVSFKRIRP